MSHGIKPSLVLIDSASISQVEQCLDLGTLSQYPWSIREALKTTAILLRHDKFNIALAPNIPSKPRSRSMELEQIYKSLIGRKILKPPNYLLDCEPNFPTLQQTAVEKSVKWIGRPDNIRRVKETLDAFQPDVDYRSWIDWAARRAWDSHATRFGGLFDLRFKNGIARVMELDDNEILDLHIMSTDLNKLKQLHRFQNDDYRVMCRAFVSSAIIRGRYHEEISPYLKSSLAKHPLRSGVSRKRARSPIVFDSVELKDYLLACVVLGAAMNENGLSQRIETWASNIEKIYQWKHNEGLCASTFIESENIIDIENKGKMIDFAIIVSRQAGISLTSSDFDDFLQRVDRVTKGCILKGISSAIWVPKAVASWAVEKLVPAEKVKEFLSREVVQGNELELRRFIERNLNEWPPGRLNDEWSA